MEYPHKIGDRVRISRVGTFFDETGTLTGFTRNGPVVDLDKDSIEYQFSPTDLVYEPSPVERKET